LACARNDIVSVVTDGESREDLQVQALKQAYAQASIFWSERPECERSAASIAAAMRKKS
jgi:hypothetical protein